MFNVIFLDMVTIGRLRTKLSMFKLFFEMSSGQHLKCPYFNMATTKKFILESPSIPGVPSRLDVDGECIFTQANEPISVSIIPSMCTISV